MTIKTLVFSLLSVCVVSLAAAQEQGLYAPAPPADAAFVRLFNASAGELNPTLGEANYSALPRASVSAYQIVRRGSNSLEAGSVTGTLELSAGRFYTVLITDTASLIEDPSLSNRAKTLLLLYNLSDAPVNLKTADGATDVIPDVAPGEVGSIEVNPISIAFGAFQSDSVLYTTDTVQLERGAAYSTFVLPDSSATFSQNTTITN